MITKALFLTFAFLLETSGEPITNGQVESLEALLSRVRVEYGLNADDVLMSMMQSGTTYSIMRRSSGQVQRVFDANGCLEVRIRYDNGDEESRLLDGDRAERDGIPAHEPMIAAMRLQWSRLQIPGLFLISGAQVNDLGVVISPAGVALRQAALELGKGRQLIIAIDSSSARVLEYSGSFAQHGAVMKFGAVYDDFRRIDGILVPFREHLFAMNQRTGVNQLETVRFFQPQAKQDSPAI
jgi:hypothetical protein